MANTYELTTITVDVSSGSPVVTATGKVKVPETNSEALLSRTLAPQGAALTRTNAVVQDALAYLSAQFGVTLTLPGA